MYVHQINIQQHYKREPKKKQIETNTVYVGTDCILTRFPRDFYARKKSLVGSSASATTSSTISLSLHSLLKEYIL